MRRTASPALILLALALTQLGCPPEAGPDPVPQPAPVAAPGGVVDSGEPAVKGPFSPAGEDDLTALTQSNNAFASALYGHLAKTQKGSFAASPVSISIALAMTYAGARDATSKQMRDTLRLSLESDATHRAFGTLLRSWAPKADAQYQLTVANRLFGHREIAFDDSYVEVTRDHYQAPLEKVDFRTQPDAARVQINDWVADKTKDKITDLLPEGSITSATALVLTNAIYFNGTWTHEFDEAATRPVAFHTAGGEVQAPTMHMQEHLTYGEADDNKLLTLFYRGSPIAMTIVLPDERDGLAETEKHIAAGKLDGWLKKMGRARVDLALPKFKISGASIALKETLSAMGMPLPFDERRADFRGMAAGGEPNLFLSNVFHKAFVDVHEKGTEAAAATAPVMMLTSAPLPSDPKPFKADHPFVFFIRDAKTGSILFMGRVTDPTK